MSLSEVLLSPEDKMLKYFTIAFLEQDREREIQTRFMCLEIHRGLEG